MEHKYCSTEGKYGEVEFKKEVGTKGPLSFFISTTSQIFQQADGLLSPQTLSADSRAAQGG